MNMTSSRRSGGGGDETNRAAGGARKFSSNSTAGFMDENLEYSNELKMYERKNENNQLLDPFTPRTQIVI